jgi:hypothetical protein
VALLIPFDPSGLDPKVVSALDDIITAIQTWSVSPFGLATRRLRVKTAPQTITNSADPFSVTWSQAPNDSEILFDASGMLDSGGVFVNFTQPGVYLMSAECWFAGSAVGIRYAGIFGTSDLDVKKQVQVPSMASNQTIDTGMFLFHVTNPVKYRVGVFQNSGGGLSLLTSILSVVQLS